jgi:hypothetical protein
MLTSYFQLRPYLLESTGSRPISKVKLVRAALVLQCESMWESAGAVVFGSPFFDRSAGVFFTASTLSTKMNEHDGRIQ